MLPRSSMDAPAFEPRGNAVVRHRVAALAAGDAGLRARLGFFFLQVPLWSLPYARSCFVLFLISLGRAAGMRTPARL
jgi:hypothetical protein